MAGCSRYNPAVVATDRPVCPRVVVEIGECTVPSGWARGIACIVVYVRNTARGRREFLRFCESTGVAHSGEPVDGINAFEVFGTPESLERLSEHPSVVSWHMVSGVKEARRAAGAGKSK